ncbi:MAG: glycosyltransferase family 4 protein [Ignavibacteriae bacterium]|nr:glycosyltransferase family 4 protein [Ignavibacteriota bacterium]
MAVSVLSWGEQLSEQIRSMKILELIDDAYIGGGQRHVLLLADGLKRRGVDVSVACAPTGYLVDEFSKRSIATYSVSLENRLRPVQFFQLVRLLRDHRFTLIHTHGGTAGLWGRLAAFFAGVPARIHTYHGIHAVYRANPITRWVLLTIERFLLSLTSYIICVSQGDSELGMNHRLFDSNKVAVIPNGIEVSRFDTTAGRQRIRIEFGCTDSDVLIGSIGRLHFQKGFVYLLEAAQAVLQKRKNVRFVLVGDGPLSEMLVEKCTRLGISSSVHFAGTRLDIPDVLSGFDIFVLPSLWEGLPLVLLEASAAGKAIVATAVDGSKEIVQDNETGVLVPPESPSALAEAIIRLVDDKSFREQVSRNARAIAREKYSADKMVEDTMNLYIAMSKQHGII